LTLGVVYHMPFWTTPDGALWEAEGSFARYIDSLAPYFKAVVLAVPVFDRPPASGTRVRASNVRLAPLPYFPGPRQFYPQLLTVTRRLRSFVGACDIIHLRIPSPAAIVAYELARRRQRPVFALVVGDYRALLPHLRYRGIKRALFAAYVGLEEHAVSRIARGSLLFTNGAALRTKHESDNPRVFETKTTTLTTGDINTRTDTCSGRPVRLLTVSRIDPRKNLRVLPEAVATLTQDGVDVALDIVGPPIGFIGEQERAAIEADAARLHVDTRVRFRGAVALDELMRVYRDYDVFVLPTGPGEGIPRVLLEAMAAGLPVITSASSGIESLVTHEDNGLVLAEATSATVAAAVRRVVETPALRQRLIEHGYATARAHTLDAQAASMMAIVTRELDVTGAQAPRVA
jgi:glycosyltransferase involved in cell wall biosynthesis